MSDRPLLIEAINLEKRIAVLSNGETVPVTKLYRGDGKETEHAEEAITFVAGRGVTWFAEVCRNFEFKRIN